MLGRNRSARVRSSHLIRQSLGVVLEQLEQRTLFGFFAAGPVDEVPPPTPPPCDSVAQAPSNDPNAGKSPAATTGAPVGAFDGMPDIQATDLSSDAFGIPWGQTRSWSGLNNGSLNGNGWAVDQLPYLVVGGGVNGASSPGWYLGTGGLPGTEDDDRITAIFGGTGTYNFIVPTSSPYDSFSPWGSQPYTLERVTDGGNTVLRLTDPLGNWTEFNDVARDSNDRPMQESLADTFATGEGRFLKWQSADGSSTIEATYDSNGYVTAVTQSDSTNASGMLVRYAYSYATVTNDLLETISSL